MPMLGDPDMSDVKQMHMQLRSLVVTRMLLSLSLASALELAYTPSGGLTFVSIYGFAFVNSCLSC